MELTKLSTKGQVVIPEIIRKGLAAGTAFSVSRKEDLIILKPVQGLSKHEEKELEEVNRIWKDIDAGNCESYEAEEFFEEMNKW